LLLGLLSAAAYSFALSTYMVYGQAQAKAPDPPTLTQDGAKVPSGYDAIIIQIPQEPIEEGRAFLRVVDKYDRIVKTYKLSRTVLEGVCDVY
jgi:hypothetical protein